MNTDTSDNTQSLDVYAILPPTGSREKPYWQKVGVAFVRRGGFLKLLVNAIPLSGELMVAPRSAAPADEEPRPA